MRDVFLVVITVVAWIAWGSFGLWFIKRRQSRRKGDAVGEMLNKARMDLSFWLALTLFGITYMMEGSNGWAAYAFIAAIILWFTGMRDLGKYQHLKVERDKANAQV